MKYSPELSLPQGGVHRYITEDADGNTAVATLQNHEAILDKNKAMSTHNDGYSPSREFRRVASIPYGLLAIWREQYGVDVLHPDHRDLLKRLLNDPDYQFLRTAPGRI